LPSFVAASPPEANTQTTEQRMLSLACATCRGYCCRLGGEHAFLDTTTLQRYMSAHPQLAADQVVGAFLAKLPEKGYRNSCVFHAGDGCTLPRAMRSDICNSFYCNGLRNFRTQLDGAEAPQAFAVAASDGQLRRATIFDHRGIRRHLREPRR
jgi:hypothetical protein